MLDAFVVAYRDAADSNHGTAKVGTVSGTDISFGAEAEFLSADGAYYVSAAALDAGRFVVAYRDAADSNHGTARVGMVSGTDISFGAEAEFLSADGAVFVSVAALDSGRFVVAYSDAADSGHGAAKVGTVSGSGITFGAEAEFLSAGAAAYISTAALGAAQFVVAYQDGADGDHGTAKVGTVSGTGVTFGAEAEFLSAGAAAFVSAAALSGSQFVVAFRDGADSGHGTARVGVFHGAAISFGAEAEFLSAGGAFYVTAAALSGSQFVVAYWDGADSGHGTVRVGTVSGTAAAFGAEVEFLSAGAASYNSAAALGADSFVVAYRNESDSGHGEAKAWEATPSTTVPPATTTAPPLETLSLSDSTALSDAETAAAASSQSDSASLSDSGSMSVGLSQSDSVSLSDAESAGAGPSQSDSVSLSDSIAIVASGALSILDSVSFFDSESVDMGSAQSDFVALSDAAVVGIAKSDSVALLDDEAAAVGLTRSDSATMSDAATPMLTPAPRYLLESGAPDGYLLEDGSGVLLIE